MGDNKELASHRIETPPAVMKGGRQPLQSTGILHHSVRFSRMLSKKRYGSEHTAWHIIFYLKIENMVDFHTT